MRIWLGARQKPIAERRPVKAVSAETRAVSYRNGWHNYQDKSTKHRERWAGGATAPHKGVMQRSC